MADTRADQIAVIFTSVRTHEDEDGYQAAATQMEALAALQPGYRGMVATRGPDGLGITISYWDSEHSALAWRDNAEHRTARDAGRDRWYASYTLDIAVIRRSYDWTRHD